MNYFILVTMVIILTKTEFDNYNKNINLKTKKKSVYKNICDTSLSGAF